MEFQASSPIFHKDNTLLEIIFFIRVFLRTMAARTKLFEEQSVYTWEIENYSQLTRELASPPLYFFDGSKWELVLRPGVFHNFQEQDVIYVRRSSVLTTAEHRISAKVWIRDKDGERWQERSQEDIYIADGWNYLIWSIDKAVLEREKDNVLFDDTLVVQCRLGSRFSFQADFSDIGMFLFFSLFVNNEMKTS